MDVLTEATAVKEAKRLAIPLIALVDSNSDPDPVDFVIPGNDDAIRSIDLVASVIAEACREGREIARKGKVAEEAAAEQAAAEEAAEAAEVAAPAEG